MRGRCGIALSHSHIFLPTRVGPVILNGPQQRELRRKSWPLLFSGVVWYNKGMKVVESSVYSKWFGGLKDRVAKARINRRIKRAARGDYGDVKPVGEKVSELRLHFGPGYRIYFTERNGTLFVVLAGGVKNTQREDIALAKEIAKVI